MYVDKGNIFTRDWRTRRNPAPNRVQYDALYSLITILSLIQCATGNP